MQYAIVILSVVGIATSGLLSPTQNDLHSSANSSGKDNTGNGKNKTHNSTVYIQKAVLQLLANLQHDNPYQSEVEEDEVFNPFRNGNEYNNHEAVLRFLRNFNKNRFIPKDEVFSPSNQNHLNQVAQLFNFLYSARHLDTLLRSAAWARERFNPEQFAHALISALANHPLTRSTVAFPALYEILPHSFVPATALQKIYQAKFRGEQQATVRANYSNQNRNNIFYNSGNRNNDKEDGEHSPRSVFAGNDGAAYNRAGRPENPDSRVSYFTEDIGVNAFHAGYHYTNPSFHGCNFANNYWISNKNNVDNVDRTRSRDSRKSCDDEEDIRRGEEFYYVHRQLYARYVLERLSNGLPVPEPIDFDEPVQTGYNPNLQYPNGQAVPARPPNVRLQRLSDDEANAKLPNNDHAQSPATYERRLQEAALSGHFINEDGSKTKLGNRNGVAVLANLAAAPGRSPNPAYYGNYFSTATNAIGNIVDPNNQNGVAPGAVSNYATAARDPAYYNFLAKFLQIFNNFQNNQGPYSQAELAFPGVKIQSLDISRLLTFFESYNVNVNSAVDVNPNGANNVDDASNVNGNFNVKFQRLNNKPYNYKLVVQSSRNANAVVRLFIGPEYDSNGQKFTLPQASQYFVQLDQFTVRLSDGKNKIRRNSQDSPNFNKDYPSFKQLWNDIQNDKESPQQSNGERNHWRIPQRLMLPKGSVEGQQFVLYAIINEVNGTNGDSASDSQIEDLDKNNDDSINNDNDKIDDCNDYDDDNNIGYELTDIMYNYEYDDGNGVKRSSNLNEYNSITFLKNGKGSDKQDVRSIGFPFDRPVQDINYNSPNQIFKTVKIYHKIVQQDFD